MLLLSLVAVLVTFGMETAVGGAADQGRGTDGEAVGPEGMRPSISRVEDTGRR